MTMNGGEVAGRWGDRAGLWPHPEGRSIVAGGRLRRRPRPGRWIVGGTALLLLADGAASLLLRHPATPPAPAVRTTPAGPAAWVPIPAPLPLYGLSGSGFARLPLRYEARRDPAGEARQDVLTFGAFGGTTSFLRLVVTRAGPGLPEAAAPDLLVELARLASLGGLAVTRIGLPLHVMTRFGTFDTVDATLAGGEAALPCVGFRLGGAPAVGIAGLACGSAADPLDRGTLGCVLDRIDLLSAGEDTALRDAFAAAAQTGRPACEAAPKARRLK